MAQTAKSSLTGFFLTTILSFFLWYRNQEYDRVLAVFILILGFIQLIEYGSHSTMKSDQGAKFLLIILWFQCLAFALATWIYVNNIASLAFALIYFVIFALLAIKLLMGDDNYSQQTDAQGNIEWLRNGGPLISYPWIYIIGIIGPLVLLLQHYHWNNIGLFILLLYVLVAFFLLSSTSHSGNLICYLIVGFAFTSWLIGLFSTKG